MTALKPLVVSISPFATGKVIFRKIRSLFRFCKTQRGRFWLQTRADRRPGDRARERSDEWSIGLINASIIHEDNVFALWAMGTMLKRLLDIGRF